MFRGISPLNLDSKGRMTMPTRYRERVRAMCDGHLVITVDRDRCLLLYPLPEWDEIEKRLTNLPSTDKHARRLKRLLMGHATDLEMDGQGRILIPPALREFAGLKKQVVLVGQGNKFELWDEETWNTKRSQWLEEEEEDGQGLSEALATLVF